MYKLDLQKTAEPEIKLATIHWIMEKAREFHKNTDYAFDCVDHNKLEISERDGTMRLPYLPPEKPVCRSRSNRPRHGTMD